MVGLVHDGSGIGPISTKEKSSQLKKRLLHISYSYYPTPTMKGAE